MSTPKRTDRTLRLIRNPAQKVSVRLARSNHAMLYGTWRNLFLAQETMDKMKTEPTSDTLREWLQSLRMLEGFLAVTWAETIKRGSALQNQYQALRKKITVGSPS